MIPLQQFKIYKFESGRILESKGRINLTIEDARKNGEIVSMGDCQLIRFIRRLNRREFSRTKLEDLLKKRDKISKGKNSKYARASISSINIEIDDFLFIKEIISVYFENKTHYQKLENGITINGEKYIPLMASAGMIRRNSVLFCKESVQSELNDLLNNGRKTGIDVVPAKFTSYFALASSSSYPVSFPRMAVIPDKIIKTRRTVDYSTFIADGVDPVIESREMEIECNAFDGQGLISPQLAKRWSEELELGYTFSTAIVRAAFLKGMVCVFDFHKFAEEIAKQSEFVDIYGSTIDIRDVDCIISESMFKLWMGYTSTDQYIKHSVENGFDFSVSRVSPKEEKTHARSSYQFIQILDLKCNDDIERLCEPTLSWINTISTGGLTETLLYSMGDIEYSKGWFDRLSHHTRAILLNQDAVKDPYIISCEGKSISKKKNDAKMGRLLFSGNYSTLIADPYAQAASLFGLDLHLLNDKRHYSNYWNQRGVKRVAAIRSPIVHSSEVNLFNFETGGDFEKWFEHIKTGTVVPANGIGMDCAILAGGDFDGDLVCTIDHPSFIKGRSEGLPIIYDTKKTSKVKSDTDEFGKQLIKSQQDGFGTKIGFYTNVGSSMYALLSEFPVGTREREILLSRLKYFRVLQGIAIDSAKGLITDPFPQQFVKYRKITADMTDEEKLETEFNNRIIADKRPMFMRWLYRHYNKKFNDEMLSYNNISHTKWGVPFSELVELTSKTDEQETLVQRYKRRSFFINNDSEMNRVSRFVDKELSKRNKEKLKFKFDHSIYYSSNFRKPSESDVSKMEILFKEWRSLRRNLNSEKNGHPEYNSSDEISRYIFNKACSTISASLSYLADVSIYLTYVRLKKESRSFAWSVFGDEIISNMKSKKKERFVRVPQKNPNGNIEYLWDKYSMYLVDIEV